MQKQMQDLYRELEKDGVVSFKDAKNVGDAVFSALLKGIKKPPALILKVKGLGDFFLRKKKLTEHYIKMDSTFNKNELTETILLRDKQIPGYIQEKREMIELMAIRLQEYDRFVEKKLNARKERKEIESQQNKKEEDVN